MTSLPLAAHFKKTRQSAECVPKPTRDALEIEPREVTAVLEEGGTILGPHRFAVSGNHGPRKAGGCKKLPKDDWQTPAEGFSGAVFVI